jgi:NAD(P)-dependent dehydrogenase (short-subunit alcohol dehydrogenase family)
VVEALAAEGMRVVAVARDPVHLARLQHEVKADIRTYAADVTDPVAAAHILEREQPRVLVLAAGANGISRQTRLQTWETFSTHLEVDLKGVFNWTREALVLPLEEGSTIVVVSSGAALHASPISAAYGAAKAAIWAFARAVAAEAQEIGVRVHCVLPTLSPDTELGRTALAAFSKAMGVSPEEVLIRKGNGPNLTASHFGKQVLEILKDPARADTVSYRTTGSGLIALPEQK